MKLKFSWTVQFVLDVIVPFWEPPAELKDMEAGVTFSKVVAPICEILITCVSKPGEAILIIPDLDTVALFDWQVTVMFALLVPVVRLTDT